MTAPWGSVEDLTARVEAMDEDAGDLREDIVTAFGRGTEVESAADDVCAAVTLLVSALAEAGAGGS